jgi:uncharacterized membrane protein
MGSHQSVELGHSLSEVQNWAALGGGVLLLLLGTRRRSPLGVGLAMGSAPLFYRGLTGSWPALIAPHMASNDTRVALAGRRGMHVRESIRLERPIAEVYRFWRRLDNLPRFMAHLESVEEHADGRSHWVAKGPAAVPVEWDAEIINEVENRVIGWRSLPGSDVVTAGSVNFESVRGGRSTQLTVHLQYAPPAGRAGALMAAQFGRAPSQTIREDLRRLKQLLEAGEVARAVGPPSEVSR